MLGYSATSYNLVVDDDLSKVVAIVRTVPMADTMMSRYFSILC